MPQVGIRLVGSQFCSDHEETGVGPGHYIFVNQGFGERRPPGTGFIFIQRAEQRLAGNYVHIYSGFLIIPVDVVKWRLRTVFLGDLELQGCQPFHQLAFGRFGKFATGTAH